MQPTNARGFLWQLGMLVSLMLALALVSAQLMPALAWENHATTRALPMYHDNAVGNLALISPQSGPDIPISPKGWNDVPGLNGLVYSRAGDNLEIAVTAEINGPGTVHLRALVDGAAAAPSDVAYKFTGDVFDGVRSFTFVKQQVSAGSHLIQIQWIVQPGATAAIGDRTLSINSAASGWGAGRLAVAAAPSGPWVTKTTPTWEDIPHMVTTLTTDATRDFKITFSAETSMLGGRFFAQALLDGQYVANVLFDDVNSATRGGTRSFTFVKQGVSAGAHTVRIQWLANGTGADIAVGDRTLSVFAGPPTSEGGGLVAQGLEGPPVVFSSAGWADVPNTSRSLFTSEPSTNAQVTFSAELAVSNGRMFLRALIDGQPAQPSDVVFVANGAEMRAQSFVFVQKNLLPGAHTVQIQALVDPGATGWLADRSVSVLFKRRQGADFAQPYDTLKPRQGTFPFLVICFDPIRPGETRPTNAQIVNQHRGDDGQASVRAWYQENTGGRYVPGAFSLLGCGDNQWFEAPLARQGTWYWDNKAFTLMWEDAIKAADPFFDFHQHDRNGDNRITGDELMISILRPQNISYGTQQSLSVAVDGISAPLTIDMLDVYFSAINANRVLNVGLVAHEAAHALLGAADMYTYGGYTTSPGWYSLMDTHFNANHLDPFHKLKSGHLAPDLIEINAWTLRTVRLAAVETQREVLIVYHPSKHDREYFIIENRWGGTTLTPNYDSTLPAQGIAVWHIVEDLELANQFRPPGTPSFTVYHWEWGRLSIRFLGILASSGAAKELMWADGTSSQIEVMATGSPAEFVDVNIMRLDAVQHLWVPVARAA